MIDEGYAATQILSQFHDVIIEEKLNDKQKSVITEKMAVSKNISAYICAKYFKVKSVILHFIFLKNQIVPKILLLINY